MCIYVGHIRHVHAYVHAHLCRYTRVCIPLSLFTYTQFFVLFLYSHFPPTVAFQEYKNFRINNDGALEGVGLLIASEPDTGRLVRLGQKDNITCLSTLKRTTYHSNLLFITTSKTVWFFRGNLPRCGTPVFAHRTHKVPDKEYCVLPLGSVKEKYILSSGDNHSH